MKFIKTFILFGIFLFLGFVIYNAVNSQNKHIATVNAEYRTIEEKLVVSGTIEPQKEIEVKSTISGVLEKLYVQIGNEVVCGQDIAKIQLVVDPVEYEQLVKEKTVAQIRFENVKNEFERTKQLFDRGVIAKEEFERGQTDFKLAQSEYSAIIVRLNMLKGNYAKKEMSNTIYATGDGTILELPVKEGGSILARGTWNERSTVAKIADLNVLIFKGYILESDILKLHVGMKMNFSLATQRNINFEGTLQLINPKAFVQNGVAHFEIVAGIFVPDTLRQYIKAGGSANGIIVLGRREHVLSLEEKYFQFIADSIFVEVESKNGQFTKQFITTGISDGIFTEIISGIDSLSKIKDEK